MPVPVRWDVDRGIALYTEGKTLREVAAELGITSTTVRTQLVKAGVAMRPARLPLGRPDVDTDEVIRLRDDEHMTWAGIGEAVGAPEQTVFARYRRTKLRKPKARQPRPWRRLLLAALEQAPEIEVASVIVAHLGRRPTRAEAIAARRAANRLVSSGRAVRYYAKIDTNRGARVHLLLGQPGQRGLRGASP